MIQPMRFMAALPSGSRGRGCGRRRASARRPFPRSAAGRRASPPAPVARGRRCRAGRGLLQQLVERQRQQVGAVARVDHDLGDVRVDLRHGVDVEAVARHLRCLLVFGELPREALGVALGLVDDARLVALGFLAQARRRALRLRDLGTGVGQGFLLQAVAVLAGLQRVFEGRLHLLGRLHALHVDVDDDDAGLQAVELRLHRADQVRRDRVALLVQHRVDLAAADDLAHRRFGGQRHRVFRIAVLEQEFARVLDPVLHGEADVDDVLVLRQHRRIAQARRLADRIAADLLGAQLRHVDRLVGLEGIGQAPLEAGVDGVAVAPERGDHRLLAFLDDEDAAAEPDQDDDAADQRRADAGTAQVGLEVRAAVRVTGAVAAARAAAAPAEQAAQLAIEVAPQLVEVGRPVAAAVLGQQRRLGLPVCARPGGQSAKRAGGDGARRVAERGPAARRRGFELWRRWGGHEDSCVAGPLDRSGASGERMIGAVAKALAFVAAGIGGIRGDGLICGRRLDVQGRRRRRASAQVLD